MPFKCPYCGGLFCKEHRLPEAHNCPSLKEARYVPHYSEVHAKSPSMHYTGRRAYNNWQRSKGSRKRPILVYLIVLWVFLVAVGALLELRYSVKFLLSLEYYWIFPVSVLFIIGVLIDIKIWHYGTSVHNIKSAWKRRLIITSGVIATGALLFFLFIGLALVGFLMPPYEFYMYNQPYISAFNYSSIITLDIVSNLMLNVLVFTIVLFFGFLITESYLLYRIRHHYTISRF